MNKSKIIGSRRSFLKTGLLTSAAFSAGGYAAWHHFFDGPIFNACELGTLPEQIRDHKLMHQALEGVEPSQLWDCHFHLIGNGLQPGDDGELSGIWLNPGMTSWKNFTQRLQYSFYLDAACLQDDDNIDQTFIEQATRLLEQSLPEVKFLLLAFDYQHADNGTINQSGSTFYVPNSYASKVASLHPQLEWIGSVHPYREDALEALEWCAKNGARAIKWLPPAMNIDPGSAKCDAYYTKLLDLGLPLLTHAGEEKAVHSEQLQKFSNPLLLRRPLEQGVKVIVAHCASLGTSPDLESNSNSDVSNFELFARLMNDSNYESNLLADISAVNLFNRDISEIRKIIENQQWHSRLLYASDYPLPGVMPIISSKNLASHGLLEEDKIDFLSEVRRHNVWLFDFLQKRFLTSNGHYLSSEVFSTRRHFEPTVP